MKFTLHKRLMLTLAAALTMGLVACGPATPASSTPLSSSPASSAAVSTAPSLPSSSAASAVAGTDVAELSSFLTPEQAQLYDGAYATYLQLIGMAPDDGRFFAPMQADTPMEEADYNGIPYYKATGTAQTWDEFYAVVTTYFTPEYFDMLNGTNDQHPLWVSIDGQLYNGMGARGANSEYVGPDLYRLLNQSEEAIEFMVVGQYETFDTSEPYKEDIPVILTNTADGWRFSLFGITI